MDGGLVWWPEDSPASGRAVPSSRKRRLRYRLRDDRFPAWTTGWRSPCRAAARVFWHQVIPGWYREAVREAEARALDDLSRLLVRLGRTATATLARAMTDPATPWATRVRAADASLGRLLQLRELATLEARVVELERLSGLAEVEAR